MAGTPRVNCRAVPWTDFVPCTRSTRTHSHVRCSRTSSRSVQKLSAGYYGASGSHRERSGPGWQRGKEGAEKSGLREEDKWRRTEQLRSSPGLDRTTHRDRIKGHHESSQGTSFSSSNICPSGRAKCSATISVFSLASTYIIRSFVPTLMYMSAISSYMSFSNSDLFWSRRTSHVPNGTTFLGLRMSMIPSRHG